MQRPDNNKPRGISTTHCQSTAPHSFCNSQNPPTGYSGNTCRLPYHCPTKHNNRNLFASFPLSSSTYSSHSHPSFTIEAVSTRHSAHAASRNRGEREKKKTTWKGTHAFPKKSNKKKKVSKRGEKREAKNKKGMV